MFSPKNPENCICNKQSLHLPNAGPTQHLNLSSDLLTHIQNSHRTYTVCEILCNFPDEQREQIATDSLQRSQALASLAM